eukprot:Seg13511.2 transcript_id=Seg13511.2/GoldUCD/mRNA.D3Y31 product="hypothetical protein" protein_id=Seg13511.2/GoldUCD/D3Y31
MSEETTPEQNQENQSQPSADSQPEKTTGTEVQKTQDVKTDNSNSAVVKLLLLGAILFAAVKWGKPMVDSIAANTKSDKEEVDAADSKKQSGEGKEKTSAEKRIRVLKGYEDWVPRIETAFDYWVKDELKKADALGYEIQYVTVNKEGTRMSIQYHLFFDEKKYGKKFEIKELYLEKDDQPRFLLRDPDSGDILIQVYDPNLVK